MIYLIFQANPIKSEKYRSVGGYFVFRRLRLITAILATAFVVVGCCITMYICIVNCYCITKGVEVDEYKLMVVVVFGVSTKIIIFGLALLSFVIEKTSHLTL